MEEKKTMWPDHFPTECPPKAAKSLSGKVYRFTNRTNPKHKDFLSYYDMKPGENWGRKACDARGLSVYSTIDDCRSAAATVPALRKKCLCVAEPKKDFGVIANTDSQNTKNHKTLWPLINAEELSRIFHPSKELT